MSYSAVAPLSKFVGMVTTASGEVRLLPRRAGGDDEDGGGLAEVGEALEHRGWFAGVDDVASFSG